YRDARKMLKQLVEEKWIRAKAVFGLWPANAVGDDVVVWESGIENRESAQAAEASSDSRFSTPHSRTLHFLRQQADK
ncbi:vitamin B12 dependent-methionine synthase activation domain-containing protein, partial [Lysobacter sp. 2RAB21]